jgi:hypothetical protein
LRPREQLPTERDRFAVAARINHRFGASTLRAEERLYVDSWGIKATTTDARFLYDFYPRLQLGPHLRVHGQSGASFHRLAYVGETGGAVAVPQYRTTARELAPLFEVTLGGTARVMLSSERSERRLSLVLSNDAMLAHYFDSLFVTSRTAYYATLGLEAEL